MRHRPQGPSVWIGREVGCGSFATGAVRCSWACQGCIHPAHFPKAYISSSQLGQAQCHQRAATPTQPAKFPMSAIAAGDREIASRIGFSAHFRASSTGRMNDLPRVICPSGIFVSSPLCKNISLHPSGKSSLQIRAIPPHNRGVSRSSRTRGGDAVDAAAFCARRDRRAGR